MLTALQAALDCGVIRADVNREDFIEAYDNGLLDCRAVHNEPGKLDYYLSKDGVAFMRYGFVD